jgi:thioredoxin-related protein
MVIHTTVLLQILMSCVLFSSSEPSEPSVQWHSSLELGWELAKQENKQLLVYVGSKTCSPCRRIEKNVFSTQVFQEYAGDLILVKIDDYNDEAYYNKTKDYLGVQILPSFFLYRPDGTSSGWSGGIYEVTDFISILEKRE